MENENQKPATTVVQPQNAVLTPQRAIERVQDKFVSVVKESGLELNWEKEKSYALQAIHNNPFLAKQDLNSIAMAVYNVALYGLTLNPKKAYCYLVPRGGKVILDISYQGMLFIMTNQLDVSRINSEVIYANDYFSYKTTEKGQELTHEPNLFAERGEALGVYAIAYLNKGGCVAVVLNNKEINEIKATSQASGTKHSPWNGDETIINEMKKKTAIRRLFKIIPKTDRIEEVYNAVSFDDENNQPKWKKVEEVKPLDDLFEAE